MDFTVTVDQNGTRSHTLNDAVYNVRDGWVVGHCGVTLTAAGSAGNAITVTATGIPAPASTAAGQLVGRFRYNRIGVAFYAGIVSWTGTTFSFRAHLETADLGADPSFATANTDLFRWHFKFRHA